MGSLLQTGLPSQAATDTATKQLFWWYRTLTGTLLPAHVPEVSRGTRLHQASDTHL